MQGPASMGILQLMEDVSIELSGKMSLSSNFIILSLLLWEILQYLFNGHEAACT